MIKFEDKHKEIRISSGQPTTVEWFDEEGKLVEHNVQAMTDEELFTLRATLNAWHRDQLAVLDAEINNWQPIYCSVCGEEDLAFRGRPFVTWGLRGGYILCPRHLRAFDHYERSNEEIIAQARQEDEEIRELFG